MRRDSRVYISTSKYQLFPHNFGVPSNLLRTEYLFSLPTATALRPHLQPAMASAGAIHHTAPGDSGWEHCTSMDICVSLNSTLQRRYSTAVLLMNHMTAVVRARNSCRLKRRATIPYTAVQHSTFPSKVSDQTSISLHANTTAVSPTRQTKRASQCSGQSL